MSSRWSEGFRTALTLRLGLWYAGLFAVSAAVLLTFTYLLLGRALAAQDREVLESMLRALRLRLPAQRPVRAARRWSTPTRARAATSGCWSA